MTNKTKLETEIERDSVLAQMVAEYKAGKPAPGYHINDLHDVSELAEAQKLRFEEWAY